jgi:hypothetical protein
MLSKSTTANQGIGGVGQETAAGTPIQGGQKGVSELLQGLPPRLVEIKPMLAVNH